MSPPTPEPTPPLPPDEGLPPRVKRLLAKYDDRVRYVVRYMPLHGNSVYAAGALEAAGAQGRYWDMLEALFLYQPAWGSHAAPRTGGRTADRRPDRDAVFVARGIWRNSFASISTCSTRSKPPPTS